MRSAYQRRPLSAEDRGPARAHAVGATAGILSCMTALPARVSAAANTIAKVVDTPRTGPARAEPIGTPAKLRPIETAKAGANHARAVRRWRSEKALTLDAASAPPAIAIPIAITAIEGTSSARTARPMTAPKRAI